MDKQNEKIDDTVSFDKTVVLDRDELTELMTTRPSTPIEKASDFDFELEAILREAQGYDLTPPEYIPEPEPAPVVRQPVQEYVVPEVSENAKRIISEKAMESEHRRKKRVIIICAAVAAALALLLGVVLIIGGSGAKREYSEAFNSAQLLFYDSEYDEALTLLREAMAIDKTDECLILMSQCYEAKSDYVNAISILESSNTGNDLIIKRIEKLKAAQEEYENGKIVLIGGEQYDVGTTVLDLSSRQLRSGRLQEICRLKELTSLKLADNEITDISALAELKKLVSLDLSDNSISDIKPLAGLTELRTLHLDGNKDIKDLSPLYNLSNLTMLTIGGIEMTESKLSELKEMLPGCIIYSDKANVDVAEIVLGGKTFKSDVTKLDLTGAGITDISRLSVCTKLSELYLGNNYISDISPLLDIPGLVVLDLSNNSLSDIRPLMSMTTLEHLNLAGNSISSITALSQLTGLKELLLNGNPINGTQTLGKLTALNILGLKNTGLTDEELGSLYTLKSLAKLSIEDNSDLGEDAVAKLQKKLPKCKISHSELMVKIEFAGKKYDANIETLEAKGLGLSDIKAISGFKALKNLDLSGNIITNIEPLSKLTTLTTLDLTDNNIADATPLYSLSELKQLWIGKNALADEQIDELRAALPNCTIIIE